MSGRAYKAAMTVAAVVAWLAAGHLGMLAVIGYCWLTVVSSTNSAKSRANEKRLDGLVPAVASVRGRIGNLSGAATSTSGLADGTLSSSSHSATAGLTDGTINGTSGGASAGTAHTHTSGSYAVADGTHNHGRGTYAVSDGTHSHTLPAV